jgi:hypothetical protein
MREIFNETILDMSIFELYKTHINPDVNGIEIHDFFKRFNLESLIISNPLDEKAQKEADRRHQEKRNIAIEWILRNSKLAANNL